MLQIIRLLAAFFIFSSLTWYILTTKQWHKEKIDLFTDVEQDLSPPTQSKQHWSKVTWQNDLWENNDHCLTCHPAQAEEWENSIHQLSFVDPLYRQQAASQGGDFDCLACHLSENVFDHPLGKVPPHRTDKQIEGVNCITCHVRGKRVMATRTINDAPCKPIKHDDLQTAEQCHGCHMAYGKINTLHEYDEWLLRGEKTKNHQCQDCHMPLVNRPIALGLKSRPGKNHSFEVRQNPDLFNQFFKASIERTDINTYELVLENKGTAHHFPTGYTIKSVVILIHGNLDDQENGPEVIERYELKKSTPFGGISTQLKDEEVRRLKINDLSKYDIVELSCLHKPYLLFLDSEVTPFYEIKIEPKKLPIKKTMRKK